MTLILQQITIAQAATTIDVVIALLQHTLLLGLVVLLAYVVPPVNTAQAWNVIGRRIHASLWPVLLSVDDTSPRSTGPRVACFSYLSFTTTVLVATAGVIMPLGLGPGPMLQKPPKNTPAVFVPDVSPLGLATSPRGGYKYNRICGGFSPVTCPGNTNGNASVIAPAIVDRFNATPYGPFAMQFRRYYNGTGGGLSSAVWYNYSMLTSQVSTTESLILRTGIFAVGRLIVDMNQPGGIGLWNHTLPAGMANGGSWSEDILWLEPESACVDTNLTVDYELGGWEGSVSPSVERYNLTDRGGFFNLTADYPLLNRDGQNIIPKEHAYKGAVLSNFDAMISLNNLTRNESYSGRKFPMNLTTSPFNAGHMLTNLDLQYLGGSPGALSKMESRLLCQGYGGADTANISNVAVHCSMLLGPPQRTDGGDPLLLGDNSTWTQRLFVCASATKAKMQRVEFAFNGTMSLDGLRIWRRDMDTPVLWATEKANIDISNVDLLWGRVPDSLEGDPSLSTIRSNEFYIPAGSADYWLGPSAGMPCTVPAGAWNAMSDSRRRDMPDYSGVSNFAVLQRFTLILADPENGPSQIKNLIWTDLMANNVLGTDSRTTLLVSENVSSIAYDLRYAIPAVLLLLLWLPSFLGAAVLLLTGLTRISHLKHLLTHTGAGRVALGEALMPINIDASGNGPRPEKGPVWGDEGNWAKGAGRTPVRILDPGERGLKYSDSQLRLDGATGHVSKDSGWI
ncbi:hypothetical protein C8R43DRAFT_906822 [Mycena crocata]|nr:hypothetical protein C8R43DRAFT_906822 [Mycena crocata]